MFFYVLRRLMHGVLSIIGASILIFVISRMTGDPIVLLLPVDAPQALIDQTRETMGLDKPVWMQYLILREGAVGRFWQLLLPLGVLSAVHRGSWIDTVGKGFAMLGQAMPGFWVGVLLILIFSVELNWLPAFGAGVCCHAISLTSTKPRLLRRQPLRT
jgi:peptide/nickel transport system permease protein